MNSSRISKIAKARRYTEEPERVQFTHFEATFQGENDTHIITFNDHGWQCSCHFFQDWSDCCHTMAIQRILGIMLPAPSHHTIPLSTGSNFSPTLNTILSS